MTTVDVLVVDDDPEMARVLCEILLIEGLTCRASTSGAEAVELISRQGARMVLTDLNMPGVDGLGILDACRRSGRRVPLILLTAFGSVRGAMDAIRAGAWHYLTKPFDNGDLVLWVRRALEEVRLHDELELLRRAGPGATGEHLGSANPAMRRLLDQVPRLAQLAGTVLLTGPSGSGKERVARALHDLGHRAGKPFVAVNCSAIPETLLESELFGHEQGAFTGALRTRKGLFEIAGEGTLFLDEIGDLPLTLQAKLLRVLQDGEFRRVGSDEPRHLEARVVAATHRDLKEDSRLGRFRQDLFWRLCVLPLTLPSLQERPEDIVPLAHHFLERHSHRAGCPVPNLSPSARTFLCTHTWPGNIRELQNACERVVAFSSNQTLEAEDFAFLGGADTSKTDGDAENWPTLEEVENRYIRRVLDHTRGYRNKAAEILGVDPKTLWRRLQKLGWAQDDAGKMP